MISRSYLGFKHTKWRVRTDGSIKGISLQKRQITRAFQNLHRHITSNHNLDNEGYPNDSQPPPTGKKKKQTLKQHFNMSTQAQTCAQPRACIMLPLTSLEC
jgi:hypothetical protein